MIKEQIKTDTTDFLKQGNHEVLGVLRMTMSAILLKEKEKSYKTKEVQKDLEDDEVIGVLSSEIKKRKDAIALYEQGNRPELAKKEKQEIEILQKYLPEQLSQDDLKKLIEESISKVGAKEMKDMGRVMADLTLKVKGRADNAQISAIIKGILHG